MLTLSRREGERIFLQMPDGAIITVVPTSIDRGKVRIGIDAPADVVIWREEVAPDEIRALVKPKGE